MDQDYDVLSLDNMTYKTDNRLDTYQEFFRDLKSQIANTRNMMWSSDESSAYTYLISNPMYVLDKTTYEIINKIPQPHKLRLESPENVLTFSYNRQNLILLYNQHSIYIYSLEKISTDTENSFNNGNYIEHRITFLKSDEYIVKIYNLENAVKY
jgi:hypothetical protein